MSWFLDMLRAIFGARPNLSDDDTTRERQELLARHIELTREAEDSSRRVENLVRELLDENMRLKVERL